jgi:alginate O-acetyltransferase complex protein AlgI
MVIAFLAVVAVYAAAKSVATLRGPHPSLGPLAVFLTIWPGMRTEPFAYRGRSDGAAWRLVVRGLVVGGLGMVAWVLLATADLPAGVRGWLGVFVILATVHLGLCDVLSGTLRFAGYPVCRLFVDPLASRTLREFWSLRWNTAFVEMNQVVFMPWLRAHLGRGAHVGAFVLSGLLHELAISLPVRAGFGLPTVYFALQAVATGVEHRLRVRQWPAPLGRLWTWTWLLLPLPLLFHRAFRDALVLPLFGGNP